MSNKLTNLQKQNDSIFFSLLTRNIPFDRITIPEGISEEEHIQLLSEENNKLKEAVKANKPPPQPKEEKPKQEQPIKQEKKADKVENNDEEQEETFEEPVKKFDTITNMEEMKRAFFNGLNEEFENQLKAFPFKLYRVEYKYNSDKDGAPDFSAKNLLKGFVRNFDDFRKYFMICFRCWKNQESNTYEYKSLWIVNTLEPISTVIGSFADDFIFEESTDINTFIKDIAKIENIDDTNCIGESYVH